LLAFGLIALGILLLAGALTGAILAIRRQMSP
jgi:hypothetical protein